MVRVTDPSAGKIWLFSADTLSRIPDLYEQVEAHQVETHVPKVLVKWRFLGMPVWLWLALLVAIPIAAVLAWILIEIVLFPLMWWRGVRKQPQLADWRKVSGPVWLVLGVMIHRILVSFLGMPLLHRHYYFITARVVFTIGLGWLTLRMLSRGMDRLRERAIARGSTGTGSLFARTTRRQGNRRHRRGSCRHGRAGLQPDHRARRTRYRWSRHRLRRPKDN